MGVSVNVTNEYGRVKTVVLNIPSPIIERVDPIDAMYVERPSYSAVMKEFWDYVAMLELLGIDVLLTRLSDDKFPNWIYAKDLAFVCRGMIVIANPRWETRGREQYRFEDCLHQLGYGNWLVRPPGYINMEGADVAWLDPDRTIIMSVGNRTDSDFMRWLDESFPFGMHLATVDAHPEGVPQHLQGAFHIVDHDLIYYRPGIQPNNEYFRFATPLPESDEVVDGYALNIVTVGPREIIMPRGCPKTKRLYEEDGVKVHEAEMYEISKMGGAMACMTLVLEREEV